MGYYSYDSYDYANFSDLLGKTLVEVRQEEDKHGDDQILLVTDEGVNYRLLHFSDCCEHVYVEDIAGDLNDLIGSPILMAEEVSQSGEEDKDSWESSTWTFYKLATLKGYVTIRWYGSSNGYYSESVDFIKMK